MISASSGESLHWAMSSGQRTGCRNRSSPPQQGHRTPDSRPWPTSCSSLERPEAVTTDPSRQSRLDRSLLPVLVADREGVEPELVPEAPDPARLEASCDQEWPEVLHVVVHPVIVHLRRGTEPEPEGRELQEPLASPGRHVDQRPAP